MSSLSSASRSAATNENTRSAATRKHNRPSLCSFTFADGRRCRTPRISTHPHFCFYHSQKESRAATADKLARDLAYFFSAHYVSANDLTTALARLIPAAVRGDIKPRTARTIAYMLQTLLQAIHLSQDEYINAFGTDGWRKTIRNSVHSNKNYRFPPGPKPAGDQPEPPQPPPQPAPTPPQAQAPSPASSPLPSTPQPSMQPPQPASHPERSEGPLCDPAQSTNAMPLPNPSTQPAQAVPQPPAPNNSSLPANPPSRPDIANGDPYITRFGPEYRLREDLKLL